MYCSGAAALPVLTAASDRGRLALLRALVHGGPDGRGACVAGPRGCGKTSLVAATAATLGRHCFPLACSSATRPDALASLVAGCAAAGCVLHLTDPAALAPATLAAMSHALATVYGALAAALEKGAGASALGQGPPVTLLGTKVHLAPGGFGCVAEFTLPSSLGGAALGPHGAFAGGGFGGVGGGALPGLLRSRFRPVLLPPPDLDAIVALRLLQEGFHDYAALAPKLRLAFEALPSAALQSPCHSVGVGEEAWGLPQLAPFLTAAGLLKRTSPEVAEARLLMECLVNLVAIQLRAADALAAKTLLRDLFLSAKVGGCGCGYYTAPRGFDLYLFFCFRGGLLHVLGQIASAFFFGAFLSLYLPACLYQSLSLAHMFSLSLSLYSRWIPTRTPKFFATPASRTWCTSARKRSGTGPRTKSARTRAT